MFPEAAAVIEVCPTERAEERPGWPPLPGDYTVLQYRAPVAVCSLNSEDLVQRLSHRSPDGLAIVGTLRTENLGIERVVRNVLANPNIRFLVVCGEDSGQVVGHLPGQALASLFTSGVDAGHRISGAVGKRPILKNLGRGEIAAFRAEVELVPLIGELDEATVAGAVDDCRSRDPGPSIAVPAGINVESVCASDEGRLVQDPAGFLVIYADRAKKRLAVEHYANAGVIDYVVEGESPAAVSRAIIDRQLITRLDHAAYLGRELARAERALLTGERYVQDRAPDNAADRGTPEACGCSSQAEGHAKDSEPSSQYQ